GIVVDAIEDPHRAVAAAREEEGVELRRAQVSVELLRTFVVGTGEVAAMGLCDVFGERDAGAARLEPLLRLKNSLELRRRRDREHGDVRVARDRSRKNQV